MNTNYKSIILASSLFFALSASVSAAPGDLDPTFGNGGIVITRDFGRFKSAAAMAIQPDGKIIVVGEGKSYFGAPNWDFGVVRYNTDGSLDTIFNGTGKVVTQVGGGNFAGAASVAIQADGKIVVAGIRYNCFCSDYSFALVRYNPNGTLDTSFNGTGIVITSVAGKSDGASSVAIQSDGKIVVAP